MRDLRKKRATVGRLSTAQKIKAGLAVPILSDEAIFDLVFPGHAPVAEQYATYTEYDLDDRDNLPRMTRVWKLRQQQIALAENKDFTYDDLRVDYCDFIKNYIYAEAERDGVPEDTLDETAEQFAQTSVSEFAALLGYPRLDRGAHDPLQVLANLPFRVLMTTSPHSFLEAALEKAGKQPRTTLIRWRADLRNLISGDIAPVPPDEKPEDHPLVCHLFGLEQYPNSLVLTEDDYLDFVRDVNLQRGNANSDSVPGEVRKALSSDLLVLGFSLKSWAFRALYAGLIKSDDTRKEKRGICVQLPPSNIDSELTYLRDYLQRDARFDVEWQALSDYAIQLL